MLRSLGFAWCAILWDVCHFGSSLEAILFCPPAQPRLGEEWFTFRRWLDSAPLGGRGLPGGPTSGPLFPRGLRTGPSAGLCWPPSGR